MKTKKSWVMLGLGFLAAGYWCNLLALQSYVGMQPQSYLKVLGDVLPFEFSLGDVFVFCGYAIFAGLLGWWIAYGIILLAKKMKWGRK